MVVLACVSLMACPSRDREPIRLDRTTFLALAHERAREVIRYPAVAAAAVRCIDAVRQDPVLEAPEKAVAASFMTNFSNLVAVGALLEPMERAPGLEALAAEVVRAHPDATTTEQLKPHLNDLMEQRFASAAEALPPTLWGDTLAMLDTTVITNALANTLFDELEKNHLAALQPLVRGEPDRSPQRTSAIAVDRVLDRSRLHAFFTRVFDNPQFRARLASVAGALLAEPKVQDEIRVAIVALGNTKEVPELMLGVYSAVFAGKPAEVSKAMEALLLSPQVIAAIDRVIHAALANEAAPRLGRDLLAALVADRDVRAAYAELTRW